MPVPGIPDRHRKSQPLLDVEHEADEDAATVKAFHQHGRIGISIGVPAITAIVTAGLTWLASHHGEAPQDCASKGDLNALDKHVSDLGQSVRELQTTIGHNADQAHNDNANLATELHSYINSHK